MSRLSDPHACPDCRSPLAGPRCSGCGLRLDGPVAVDLWRTMLRADELVEQLRGAPVLPPVAAAPAAPLPARAPRRGLRGGSVAVVLLGLGGLCLLVFAAIFLGVAWGLLGLAGRSAVMAAVTLAIAACAAAVTRRGLRVSAETLWAVVGGVLALDLVAAQAAGLLGGLDLVRTTTTAGLAVGALGLGTAAWSRRTASGPLVAPQVLAALGLGAAGAVQLSAGPGLALRLGVAVGLAAAAGAAARLVRMPVLAAGLVAWGALWWWRLLDLAVEGAQYGRDVAWGAVQDGVVATWGPWWWPLLAAAGLAGACSRVGARRPLARTAGAAATLLPLVLLVNAPALTGGEPTGRLLAGALALALVLVVAATAPLPWARAAAAYAGLGAVALATTVVLVPAAPFVTAAHPVAWLLAGLVLGAAAGTVPVLLPRLVGPGTATPWSRGAALATGHAAAVTLVALAGWDAVLAARPAPAVAVVTGLVAAAVTAGAAWWRRDVPAAALPVTGAAAWTAALALWQVGADPSDPLVAAGLTSLAAAVVLAGALRDRERRETSALLLLGSGTALAAAATGSWCAVADVPTAVQALLLGGLACLVVLVASTVRLLDASRLAVEAVAGLCAVAAVATADRAATAALVLGGVAVTLAVAAAVQHLRDVRPALPVEAAAVAALLAAWAGAWAGLPAPEAFSLPAGAVLLVAGAWRVHREGATSLVLAAGLVTLLLPSLAGALPDPVSVRGLLVAVAALATLAVGVRARLATPLLLGAVAAAALVLAHLEPVAQAVPRWVVIGLVGTLLVVAGTTWESGVRRVADARRYLTALR